MQVEFMSHFLGKKVCLMDREIRYLLSPVLDVTNFMESA